jgi:hypothetical protein
MPTDYAFYAGPAPSAVDFGERRLANTLPCAYPGCETKARVCQICEDRVCPEGHLNLENLGKNEEQKDCKQGNCSKKALPTPDERQAMMSKMMMMMNDVFQNPNSQFREGIVQKIVEAVTPALPAPGSPPTCWSRFTGFVRKTFCGCFRR